MAGGLRAAWATVLVVASMGGVLLATAGPAGAGPDPTLYVRTGATGTTCATGDACGTVQAAVSKAQSTYSGAVTVTVGPGTYSAGAVIAASGLTSLVVKGETGAPSTTFTGAGAARLFYVTSGNVTIETVTVEHGKATTGGGVYNKTGTLTLTNDVFSTDSATKKGGAVFNHARATITHDTFVLDHAGTTGGGVETDTKGTATISDDTFLTDSAAKDGGGVLNGRGASAVGVAHLENDTFVADSASTSGGGFFNRGTATLVYDTFSTDTATKKGGAIDNHATTGTATLTLTASLLDGASCNTATGSITTHYNLVTTSTCASWGTKDSASTFHLGSALAPNGSAGPETLALYSDSKAVDEVTCTSLPTTDERGAPRPASGTDCDAGAYQLVSQLHVTNTTPSHTSGCWTGDTCATIQAAVTLAQAPTASSPYLTGDTVTITVAPGTYTGTVTVTASKLASLSIAGAGPSQTTVTGHTTEEDFHLDGTVTLGELTVAGGNAPYGGAVYNTQSIATFTDDTFSGDSAHTGGAVFNDGHGGGSAAATFVDDTFSADDVTGQGGAVFNDGGLGSATATFTDDTFSADTAHTGGAVSNDGRGGTATATFTDDTFSGDTASTGGAVFTDGHTTGTATATVTASILDGSSCSSSTGTLSGTYDVTTVGSCNFGSTGDETVTAAALHLATTLEANTAPTAPKTLALGSKSTAIDVVPNLTCTSTTAFEKDERGDPRPGISGQTKCDAGAFELQGTGHAPTITSTPTATFSVGVPGTFQVMVTGSAFPTPHYSLTGAPSWLSITATTGSLSGTPPAASGGVYTFTVKATNTVGTAATQTFTLYVDEAPAFTSSSTAHFPLRVDTTFTITTTGYPTATITERGTLPAGLRFVTNGNGTATISGTPSSRDKRSYSIKLTATNTKGTATQRLTIDIGTRPVY